MVLTVAGLSFAHREADMGHAISSREHHRHNRATEAVGFAAKLIGVGIFAGLMIMYCQFLIDACFRGLH